MMGTIEAYLACCRTRHRPWPRRPRLGRRTHGFGAASKPLLIPAAGRTNLHFVSLWRALSGVLFAAHRGRRAVPKTLADPPADAVSQWIAYRCIWCYLVFYPLNWLLNRAPHAGFCAYSRSRKFLAARILTDSEIEGWWRNRLCMRASESGEAEYIPMSPLRRPSVSDVMVHRTRVVLINADLPPDELCARSRDRTIPAIPLHGGTGNVIRGPAASGSLRSDLGGCTR